MPSLVHEAPLEVLRNEPSLVPRLLREALGIELPAYSSVEDASADFTQPIPMEFRADLVVHLRGAPPERAPLMGIVVEVQLARDDDKRRSWPLYVAALHARLRRPTCLLVVAADEAVARWASSPIRTLQPGSPFVPLVMSLGQVPRIEHERALREPWMAVLSALAHGNRPGGLEVARAAVNGLAKLNDDRARVFFDLICASLNEEARRALEDDMDYAKYEYQSDFARRHLAQGREEGRVLEARRIVVRVAEARIGAIGADLQALIDACDDAERLERLVLEMSTAGDPLAVEKLLRDL